MITKTERKQVELSVYTSLHAELMVAQTDGHLVVSVTDMRSWLRDKIAALIDEGILACTEDPFSQFRTVEQMLDRSAPKSRRAGPSG